MSLPAITHVHLAEGDLLWVQVDPNTSSEELETLDRQIHTSLPDNAIISVLFTSVGAVQRLDALRGLQNGDVVIATMGPELSEEEAEEFEDSFLSILDAEVTLIQVDPDLLSSMERYPLERLLALQEQLETAIQRCMAVQAVSE